MDHVPYPDFAAADLDTLLAEVRNVTSAPVVPTERTDSDHTYLVGDDRVLFTGSFPDQEGRSVQRGLLLDRWPVRSARRSVRTSCRRCATTSTTTRCSTAARSPTA